MNKLSLMHPLTEQNIVIGNIEVKQIRDPHKHPCGSTKSTVVQIKTNMKLSRSMKEVLLVAIGNCLAGEWLVLSFMPDSLI